MKPFKTFLIATALLVLLPVLSIETCFYISGSHTKYCPLSHRMSDLSVCFILDRLQQRVLIQHGDLDTNWYFLEVRDEEISSKYQFPGNIHIVGEGDYSAELIEGDSEHILINGAKFKLEPYVET